jgi:hypothetical protein
MGRGIEAAAARLRWAVLTVWALLVLIYLAGRLGVELGPVHVQTRADGTNSSALLFAADLSILLLSAAFFQLSRMLSAIGSGEFYSARVVGSFRAFAFWLLLLAVAWIMAPLIVTLLAGPGPGGELQFHLQLRDVLTAGIALILFLVARLLERARAIESEMEEIV